MDKKHNNQSGFSMLLVVIIIGISSLIMAKSAVFLGLGEIDSSSAAAAGDKSYYLAESCVEDALLRIKTDNAYLAQGKEIIFTDDYSCNYSVADGDGGKIITAESLGNGYTKKIQATVTASSSGVVLGSYMEGSE
jgi:hypothetical protein